MPKRTELVALEWSLSVMSRVFRGLAISFALVDAGRADRAIHEIEAAIAADLAAFREKTSKGITVDIALTRAVTPLRDMTQDMRAMIQHGGNPKQRRHTGGDITIASWTLTLMARAFRDLAVSFATVDGIRADCAIDEADMTIVRSLMAFRETSSKRAVDAAEHAVMPLREMTQNARALIEQAGKPKN
jgi:hypothetical protein